MLRNTVIRVVVGIFCIAILAGCSKKQEPTPAPAPQEQTKTAAEYKAEAEKEIQQENASAELDKLEKSIEEEAAKQQ